MNAIVIDDDKIIRAQMENFIRRTPILNFMGAFESAVGVADFICNNNVSLIFVDIEMPSMSGFDFLDACNLDVQVIIISGSGKYALDAYDYDVTDFLLKPIEYQRFLKSVNRCVDKYFENNQYNGNLYLRLDGQYVKIHEDDIIYLKQDGDMFNLITSDASLNIDEDMCSYLLEHSPKYTKIENFVINTEKAQFVNGEVIVK